MFEIEVQRCTRRCAATDRELQPGERIYSALVPAGGDVVRRDYAAAAWSGPPEDAVGWWQSQLPSTETKKVSWAPSDVMRNLFTELESNESEQDLRYVLGLLMVRRKIMRLDSVEPETPEAAEKLVLYCPKAETEYRVPVVTPSPQRVAEIQEKLARLLFQ